MTLELLWPPKELNPNHKVHWSKRAAAVKAYRLDCYWCAKANRPSNKRKGFLLDFKVTFHPPDKRKRDRDNMIAAFKAGQDGMADAWGIDDSEFIITYAVGEPVKHGKVVVS